MKKEIHIHVHQDYSELAERVGLDKLMKGLSREGAERLGLAIQEACLEFDARGGFVIIPTRDSERLEPLTEPARSFTINIDRLVEKVIINGKPSAGDHSDIKNMIVEALMNALQTASKQF